jgi:hypothetical protein
VTEGSKNENLEMFTADKVEMVDNSNYAILDLFKHDFKRYTLTKAISWTQEWNFISPLSPM